MEIGYIKPNKLHYIHQIQTNPTEHLPQATKMPTSKKIFIIGGTGAQGLPIIHSLVSGPAYTIRVLTRDTSSPRARALTDLGDVELIEGTFANEDDLRKGFRWCDYAFVNIDGFNAGEKTEMFWTMRAYEIALEEGVRFFVLGALDYGLKR